MLDNRIKMKDEMKASYIDYAMSVITDRALPDVRDGLKPVQRRILWSMRDLNLTPDRPHRKSARIVGDTMGKYHPHGDSSIYEALVCMARNWTARYPLVDGHGNFGSRDGDSAAAMRYTEARLNKIALDLIADINKETVDFIPNYDDSEEEPLVLPSRVPNIFLNGTTGVAVGMASKTAPYNLNEVVAGLTAYLMNPNITMEEMVKYVPAPDFPTGGSIINQSDMLEVMGKGCGKIVIQSDYHIEDHKNKKYLVFTEVPYEINKSRLIENIVSKVNSNDLFGISDVRDESGKDIRIVIELKKNVIPDAIAEQLYQKTDFRTNFNLNNTVICDGKPVRHMGFLQMVREYCSFQIEVLNRRTSFEKKECEKRLVIVNGLLLALENIDRVVEIIRGSQTTDEAKEILKEEFALNVEQSSVILEMKLKKLVGLEKIKLENEKNDLIDEISRLQFLLDNPDEMRDLLIRELNEISRKLGDERRTKLLNISNNGKDELVLIPAEDVMVLLDGAGYIKSVKTSEYRIQGRGGQGIKNKGEEIYKNVVRTNTLDNLLVLTKKGVMFKLPVRNIPQGKTGIKGISIHNLLSNIQDDSVGFILNIKEIRKNSSIIFVTKKGIIKKSSTDLYTNFRSNGSKGIVLKDDDEVVDVIFCNDGDLITLFANNGKCCTFLNDTVASIGRVGQGVKGISLEESESVVGCVVTPSGENIDVGVFSENGYGKKINTSQLPVQGRGGKGLLYYKTTDKTGVVASVVAIPKKDEKTVNNILLVGDNNTIAIEDNLPLQGRNTLGVVVMRGSKILSAAIL